jgi:hypothetical protein
MFNQLDNVLTKLLDNAPPIVGVDDSLFGSAEISFITPEHHFSLSQDLAVNLFLYEVKENRELRQRFPNLLNTNVQSATKRSPFRVDCSYIVTAWSNITEVQKIQENSCLFGEAFNWHSRFSVTPNKYIDVGGHVSQFHAPPAMFAQNDGAKSVGEFRVVLKIVPCLKPIMPGLPRRAKRMSSVRF